MLSEILKWIFYVFGALWFIGVVGGLIAFGLVHLYWVIKDWKDKKEKEDEF